MEAEMKAKLACRAVVLVSVIALLAACVTPQPATPTTLLTATPSPPSLIPGSPTPTRPPMLSSPVSSPPSTPEPAGPTPARPPVSPSVTTPLPTVPAGISPPAITLRQPVLVDGERGRLYAAGQVNALPRTVMLSTVDGQLLADFEPSGALAVDRNHDRLVIDDGQAGLYVYAAATGDLLSSVPLPTQESVPRPQVDPATGLIFAFRGHQVLTVDPDVGTVVGTADLDVESTVCSEPAGPARIWQSHYDLLTSRLYLVLITYVCTPWTGATVVAYDMPDLAPIGRFEIDPNYQAEPFQGSLFGTTRPRMGPNQYWAWSGGEPWYSASGEGSLALRGIVADWARGLIYEAVDQEMHIVDPTSRKTVGQVALEVLSDGHLVAHDPITDQLYFLTGSGRLYLAPAADLFAQVGPPQPAPSGLPVRPVLALRVSPGWPADPFMAGLWENSECPAAGGSLFVRPDQAAGWNRVAVAPDGRCDALADLVLSPSFAQDRNLLVADNNQETVLLSTDGGHIWQHPVSAFPAGTRFESLLISSDYPSDGTLFAHTTGGLVYRSRDGGRTWGLLDVRLSQIAISHEFGEDHTLMGADGSSLFISQDRGDTWAPLGATPGSERLVLLSLAPLFNRWHVVFAFTAGGSLYRSLDGGETWEYKMAVAGNDRAQIVYAPDIEENRPVFLLHGHSLEASYDGWDSTWGFGPRFRVPAVEFTSLAISPRFADDGLLFLGTADGQVISADASPPR
jgi:outer membrane protein assembly factor BamB